MNGTMQTGTVNVVKLTKEDLQKAVNKLSSASRYDENIRLKQQELEYLMNLAQGLCSPTYALGTRINSGFATKESTICAIINLRRQIENEIKELMNSYTKIKNAIIKLDNKEFKMLLELRYLTYKTWEEIAEIMNYSPRHIVRVHEKALMSLCITDFYADNFE